MKLVASSGSYEFSIPVRTCREKGIVNIPCRDIVKASHLMPLDRKELLDSRRNQPWNSVAQGASKLMGENLTAESDTSPTNSASRVSNVQEFTREWRRLKKLPKLHQYQ